MERKSKIHSEEGRQEIIITREFNLPVELLFRAYTDADILEQWMGTKVLQLDCRPHGSWRFQTSDAKGNVLISTNGVIHEFIPNQKITRTFEMENTAFPVQLEFLAFEELSPETSRLTMKIIYKSIEDRDQMLRLPFAHGINMAHNRLQEVVSHRN